MRNAAEWHRGDRTCDGKAPEGSAMSREEEHGREMEMNRTDSRRTAAEETRKARQRKGIAVIRKGMAVMRSAEARRSKEGR